MGVPGPGTRLGILVPSSNSNAETLTASILAGQPDLGIHYSRFRLPPSLDDTVDLGVLGDAPALLNDADLQAIAFHGTSGSWTGIRSDRALCAELEAACGAPATTASVAVVEALDALSATRIGLVFPGPAAIASRIQREYATHGIDVLAISVPEAEMTNPEIALLGSADIDAMMRPAFSRGVDAVVCVGTNLRSGYLAAGFEQEFGVPVVDSAIATLWHVLRISGSSRPLPGWGALLAAH
ncbi:aspartate/glutamate racemase family protein [Arthrobacter sp. 2MCAF15]|uniref:maleate cis-trans isomerase family protein n=1 Tax=Arthrobacter sp. 2MCAF15 TaxID=3232984 RepID=UPI003F90FA11